MVNRVVDLSRIRREGGGGGGGLKKLLLTLNKCSKLKRDKVAVQAEDDESQNVLSHLVRLF